jgi:hypothetical protein
VDYLQNESVPQFFPQKRPLQNKHVLYCVRRMLFVQKIDVEWRSRKKEVVWGYGVVHQVDVEGRSVRTLYSVTESYIKQTLGGARVLSLRPLLTRAP